MKTVFPVDMVCHLWANRAVSHDIRNAQGNISTRSNGSILVSYGSHFVIGAFIANGKGQTRLFWNDGNYSVTTSRHQWKARRAIPQSVFSSAIHVPCLSMDSSSVRNLAITARDCVNESCRLIEKAQKARQNRPHLLSQAAQYFDSARQILEFTGDKKGAAGIPTVSPESTKDECATILREMKGAEYLRLAREEMRFVNLQYVAECVSDVLQNPEPRKYVRQPAIRTGSQISDTLRRAEKAKQYYVQAGRKPAPDVIRAISQCLKHEKAIAPFIRAEQETEQREWMTDIGTRAVRALADYSRSMRKQGDIRALSHLSDEFVARGEKSFDAMPLRVKYCANLESVFLRIRRILWADKLRRAMDGTKELCERFAEYILQGGYSYTVPDVAYLRNTWQTARQYGVPEFQGCNDWQVQAIAIQAETLKSEYVGKLAARNAERIEQWRRGESVSIPRDIPCMARIRGENVETSWGASVPLSHAARLVRIAERIAAKGGESWSDGSGPMVGHFRVTRIDADFGAVIGCHKFEPEESARIISDIKQTADYLALQTA